MSDVMSVGNVFRDRRKVFSLTVIFAAEHAAATFPDDQKQKATDSSFDDI